MNFINWEGGGVNRLFGWHRTKSTLTDRVCFVLKTTRVTSDLNTDRINYKCEYLPSPSFKPHTKCLIKKKIVCGSFWILSQVQSYWFLKKKKAWTKGLFVSFRMPFCITAYLKASYIPDVQNWPGTPPHPPTRTTDSSAPLLPQPWLHRSPEKQAISKTIKDPKWKDVAF